MFLIHILSGVGIDLAVPEIQQPVSPSAVDDGERDIRSLPSASTSAIPLVTPVPSTSTSSTPVGQDDYAIDLSKPAASGDTVSDTFATVTPSTSTSGPWFTWTPDFKEVKVDVGRVKASLLALNSTLVEGFHKVYHKVVDVVNTTLGDMPSRWHTAEVAPALTAFGIACLLVGVGFSTLAVSFISK